MRKSESSERKEKQYGRERVRLRIYVLTHVGSFVLTAAAAQLVQGSGSLVDGGELNAMRVPLSSMAKSAADLGHGGFSFVLARNLPKELAIYLAQCIRHGATSVLTLL